MLHIDLIFKATPEGPTGCSPGPPCRTPGASHADFETSAFFPGLLSEPDSVALIPIMGDRRFYHPTFKMRTESEKDAFVNPTQNSRPRSPLSELLALW